MGAATKSSHSKKRRTRRRHLRRTLLALGLGLPAAMLGLWIAVHRVVWLGPMLADGLRAVVGVGTVTRMEEIAYAVEDRWNRYWRTDERPQAYWEVPSAQAAPTPTSCAGDSGPPALPAFRPTDVGPVHQSWSAPGDGQWVPMRDPRRPQAAAVMYKTLLHPDQYRSWAEVFVVAVDLRQVDLRLMAGRYEPKSLEKEAKDYPRPAVVPARHYDDLLAAFNGGFKAEHGYHGMWIDNVQLVKPRKHSCTVAHYRDGSVRIGSWPSLEPTLPEMTWYRQGPRCMVEDGQMHPGLRDPKARTWGATLDGETVIRRSAIGLDREGKILYVSITNSTTAKAIALGMQHAGAWSVAQLDVNWSYPKFVTFEPGEAGPELYPVALAKGFEFSEDEYLRKRSHRDFFYLTRKTEAGATAGK